MNWLKKLFSKPKPDTLERFRSEPFKLTLVEWQKNEQLVTAMMNIARQPVWRAMMQVMRSECPSELKLPQVGTAITDRAALQAQTEGYMMAINNLEAMCAAPQIQEEPEATFAPEEREG